MPGAIRMRTIKKRITLLTHVRSRIVEMLVVGFVIVTEDCQLAWQKAF